MQRCVLPVSAEFSFSMVKGSISSYQTGPVTTRGGVSANIVASFCLHLSSKTVVSELSPFNVEDQFGFVLTFSD